MRTTYPTDLSDAEWGCLEPHLPAPKATGRPRIYPLREIINAIFYVVSSGCSWRLLPHDFLPWRSVYHYFREFRPDGTWERECTPHCASGLGSASRETPASMIEVGRHNHPIAPLHTPYILSYLFDHTQRLVAQDQSRICSDLPVVHVQIAAGNVLAAVTVSGPAHAATRGVALAPLREVRISAGARGPRGPARPPRRADAPPR
jgi:hypothetical protein